MSHCGIDGDLDDTSSMRKVRNVRTRLGVPVSTSSGLDSNGTVDKSIYAGIIKSTWLLKLGVGFCIAQICYGLLDCMFYRHGFHAIGLRGLFCMRLTMKITG